MDYIQFFLTRILFMYGENLLSVSNVYLKTADNFENPIASYPTDCSTSMIAQLQFFLSCGAVGVLELLLKTH